MQVYFEIIKFNFLRYLTYPVEMVSIIIRRLIEILFIALFWNMVSKSSGNNIALQNLLAYFLMSTALSNLIMANNLLIGREIEILNKRGSLSSYFIKPLSFIPFIYSNVLGQNIITMIVSICTLVIGIALSLPLSFNSLLLLPAALFISILISLSFNLLLGGLAMRFTEVGGIKNSMNHIMRIIGGVIIPINLFPPLLKNIVLLTPFPHMIFGPINVIQSDTIGHEELTNIIIGVIWVAILFPAVFYFWNKTLRSYESVGI
jgi:ABC-2 type transport system permease protein